MGSGGEGAGERILALVEGGVGVSEGMSVRRR